MDFLFSCWIQKKYFTPPTIPGENSIAKGILLSNKAAGDAGHQFIHTTAPE